MFRFSRYESSLLHKLRLYETTKNLALLCVDSLSQSESLSAVDLLFGLSTKAERDSDKRDHTGVESETERRELSLLTRQNEI